MAYKHQEFPRYMHHPTRDAALVRDPAAQAALGPDWHETPAAALAAAETKPAAEPPAKKKR